MSNLLCRAINLNESKLERKILIGFITIVCYVVYCSPLFWVINFGVILLLLTFLFTHLYIGSKQTPNLLLYRDSQWIIKLNNQNYSYSTANILFQFGWLILIRFGSGRKSYILPLFRDQVSPHEYHQLSLLIMIM